MSTENIEATLVANTDVGGMTDSNLEAALQLFLEREAECAELEAKLDSAKKFEAIARQTVIDKMLEQGVENFRALGYSVTRSEFIRASVLAADRDQQLEWLRQIGAGAMITESVNGQSFSALIRNDFIKEGKEPPAFVKVYKEPRLLKRAV